MIKMYSIPTTQVEAVEVQDLMRVAPPSGGASLEPKTPAPGKLAAPAAAGADSVAVY